MHGEVTKKVSFYQDVITCDQIRIFTDRQFSYPTADKSSHLDSKNYLVVQDARNIPQIEPPSSSVPPSLEAFCLLTLVDHLEDLFCFHDEILPFLLSLHKETLIAAARIKGMLNDRILACLFDQALSILNTSHTSVTAPCLLHLLENHHHMNNLRYLDMRGMKISGTALSTIARCCPRLTLLKFGNGQSGTIDAIGKSLISILPRLQKERDTIAESWDEECDFTDTEGRLMELSCICWQEIPYSILKKCKETSPAVWFNPTEQEIAAHGLPLVYYGAVEVDEGVVDRIAGGRHTMMQVHTVGDDTGIKTSESNQQQPDSLVNTIAEKFKMAYISRARRLRAKELKEARRLMNKRVVGAEAVIQQWEMEV